jgi:hypothetical protein
MPMTITSLTHSSFFAAMTSSQVFDDLLFIARNDDAARRIDQRRRLVVTGYSFQAFTLGFVLRDVSQNTVDLPFGHLSTNLSAILAFFKLIQLEHAFLLSNLPHLGRFPADRSVQLHMSPSGLTFDQAHPR